MSTERHQHQLVEVVVSPSSAAIGHRISDLPQADSTYELMLVGLSRKGEAPLKELDDLRVESGHTAVLEVNDRFFYEGRRDSDFLIYKTWEGNRVKRVSRAIVAIIITTGMVALASFSVMTMLNAALLENFAMLLTGCLTSGQLRRSFQWKTILVLGAALGLESAITGSGLSARMAHVCASIRGTSPIVALAVVFLVTVVMTNLIASPAAVAFMFPVALTMSETLGVNFKPFAIVIMIAAGAAFINPAEFQTNLMVQKDGEYRFIDFAKMSFPLTLIVGAVVLLLAPIVYES